MRSGDDRVELERGAEAVLHVDGVLYQAPVTVIEGQVVEVVARPAR